VPTKLSLLCSIFLLSACTGNASPEPYLLTKERTDSCQEEIEKTISALVNARNLTISKDVFSKSPSLILTNQKPSALGQSAIFNDLKGRKILKMYKKEDFLYIGLLSKKDNKKEEILLSKPLRRCLELPDANR